jgi:protein involved in polysaccharide export with SLBB domain
MENKTLGNRGCGRYTLASVKPPPGNVLSAARVIIGVVLAAALVAGCGPRRAPSDPMQEAAALIPPPPETPGPDYRIGVGDELHIRFLYTPDNNEQLPVRPDGRITLGVTGEIEAVGLTPGELERVIVERASSRLRDPEVTVVVTKVGEQHVYVGGEVLRPGVIVLKQGMTPLQAVMQTGGFRPGAKKDSIVLITPSADGRFNASRVNLQQVVEDGVSERVRLRANEVVFVPKSWVGNMNEVVDLYVRGLIPALPRVGVGYSLSGNN